MKHLIIIVALFSYCAAQAQQYELNGLKLGTPKNDIISTLEREKKNDKTMTYSLKGKFLLVTSASMAHKFTIKDGKLYKKVTIIPDPDGYMLGKIREQLDFSPSFAAGKRWWVKDAAYNDGTKITMILYSDYSPVFDAISTTVETWYTDAKE